MTAVKEELKYDRELNLTGLTCPVPIVMTSETVKKLKEGEVLKVIATDPGFERDIWNWSKQTKNELLRVDKENGKVIAYVRKTSEGKEPSLGYWIRFHALGVKLHLRLWLLKLNPFAKKPDHFITFVAISEGTRAEKFLKGKFGSVLIPIPDEIDPRCGVVLAVRGEKRAKELYELLRKEGFGVEAIYEKRGKDYVRVYP
ncbi:sulfurtransferase TusA family protein [Hydrogenivirga sp.]